MKITNNEKAPHPTSRPKRLDVKPETHEGDGAIIARPLPKNKEDFQVNKMETRIYQAMVDRQRRRHIQIGGQGWPGKSVGEPAETHYPNILAELEASGYWLPTMAEFADVSLEIMVAVVEDNEELSVLEMTRFARVWENRGPGYLSSHTLQVVDPATQKGKVRMRHLADLLNQAKAEGLNMKDFWHTDPEYALENLEKGIVITFAAYWWACQSVKDAMARRAREERKANRRRERLVSE